MHKRLPYLDGIRGLAVLVVILGHLRNMGVLVEPSVALSPLFNADFGVNIFFVLSGYLITTLLRAEPGDNPRRELAHFYLRRFFKLWPALVVFVTVAAIADRLTMQACPSTAVLAALTFTTDFLSHGCAKLGHTWSLTIEEVFYLAWAPLILLARARRGAIALALVLMALAIPMQTLHWASEVPKYFDRLAGIPHPHVLARLGAIATGAWLAESLIQRKFSGSWLPAALYAALVAVHAARLANIWPWLVIPFRFPLESFFAASLIAVCVSRPEGGLARAFSWRPLCGAGLISYSLYLWQQLFTHYTTTFDTIFPWQRFPGNVLWMLLCGAASYRFIEAPIQAWAKARWRGGKPAAPLETLRRAA